MIDDICENCKKWERINDLKGLCLDDMNSDEITIVDSWCDQWENKNHE